MFYKIIERKKLLKMIFLKILVIITKIINKTTLIFKEIKKYELFFVIQCRIDFKNIIF